MLGLWRQNSSKGGGGDDSSGMPRETSHGEEWQTSSQSTKAGALQVRDISRKNIIEKRDLARTIPWHYFS